MSDTVNAKNGLGAIPFMPAVELSKLVVSGEISAREVADVMLDRIKEVDPKIQAYNEVTPELAFDAADALDARIAAGASADELGPLAGVPVALKDNMNLVGTHTTCSSKLLEGFQSPYDCTAARRLVDAGTIPLGKLNMDEFAFGSSTETSATRITTNPWDTTRVPGGSSGGSAAAAAAGLATVTLGSDTGGSIRQPGAFTGTVALKPTYGRVSRYGCVAFASSLDQIGPFTRTVADNAAAFEAIAGKDPKDATSVDVETDGFIEATTAGVEGMKVAIATDLLDVEGLDPRLKQEVLDAAELLAKAGAEVVEVTLPAAKYALPAYYVLGPAEASSNLARFDTVRFGNRAPEAGDMLELYMKGRAEGFGAEAIRRIMIGTYVLSAGHYDAFYTKSQKVRTVIIEDYKKAFATADVILTPTSPNFAFKLAEFDNDPVSMYLSDYFTIPVNMAGNAAMSLPTRLIDGLPASVQITANHFNEAAIFRTAGLLESEFKFPYDQVKLG
jgi:aspartyl-tRNA(Asn)/glutamyl-tRNA(Gln) amidotransferase subunit A